MFFCLKLLRHTIGTFHLNTEYAARKFEHNKSLLKLKKSGFVDVATIAAK